MLLAWVDPAKRDDVTAAVYDREPTYSPGGARFKAGLFEWERRAITSGVFPATGRIVIGGAGGGREVLALAELGYCVAAFEPAEALVTSAKPAIEASDRCQLIVGTYSDLVRVARGEPSPLTGMLRPPIDGVVLGWGSVSHVLDHAGRLDLLQAVRTLAPVAPVLMSYVGRASEDVGRTRALLRRFMARLGSRYRAVAGDGFLPWGGFYYAMTPDELSALAHVAGYSVVQAASQPYPHALLVPSQTASR
jgi:hypothetical protein